MDEKVLHILSSCLQAKKIGMQIFFKYFPHTNEVNVYAQKEFDYSMYPDETPDYIFKYNFYLDSEDAEENITKAMKDIERLIAERKSELCTENQEQSIL